LVMFTRIHELDIPAGDFTIENIVDAADLAVWQADYGSTIKADADANGNALIDGPDFLAWQSTFGTSGGSTASVSPLPEPTSFALAACGLASLGYARRRRNQTVSC